MAKVVKREPGSSRGVPAATGPEEGGESRRQGVMERRVLRSQYLAMKNLIIDESDDLSGADAGRFKSLIDEVDSLHEQVQKPREQVADAEALLDIANTLVTSVKAHSNEGITPSDFITSLLRNFNQQVGEASLENASNLMPWVDVGLSVSHIFKRVPGCCTMLGPMNTELKQRKAVVQRKRVSPTESARPEEVDDTGSEEKSDTDKNMLTMFEILRKSRKVMLENLVLNRTSFAQTVENLFALSFLVKDGRAEITVDDSGCHFVSPRNAPTASQLASGEVSFSHFVFRFDFKDWEFMIDCVEDGGELMPHRPIIDESDDSEPMPGPSDSQANVTRHSEPMPGPSDSQAGAPTTPIRKLCRNRGLVIQEQQSVNEPQEKDETAKEVSPRRKSRRLFR